mgnify:CR=1 FL=1
MVQMMQLTEKNIPYLNIVFEKKLSDNAERYARTRFEGMV